MSDACGSSSLISLPANGANIQTISSTSYSKNRVCYYEVKAPITAKDGDYIYLDIISLIDSEVAIQIASDPTINDDTVYCNG